MKNIILGTAVTAVLIVGAGYFIYKKYLPEVVANAIASEKLPSYLPRRIQNKIEEFRVPVNKGATEMVREIHRADIPMEKVYESIDETSEEQAYALIDELNSKPIKNTDQVFDIVKKHVPANFDVEVFRKPFNDHFNVKMIRKALRYGTMNKQSKDVDIETAKAIIKKVLEEKEKEVNAEKSESFN